TGFQVFWLRENYFKEKKNLEFRGNVVFKETVRTLQSKKLNLDKVFNDSTGQLRIEMMEGSSLPFGHPAELTNVLNDVTFRVTDSLDKRIILNTPKTILRKERRPKDSLIQGVPKRGNMIISMNESFSMDSNRRFEFERKGPPDGI